MKKFFCGILLLAFCSLQLCGANAAALIDGKSIREAQEYGRQNAGLTFQEFLLPWLGAEIKKSGPPELAYIYTPYLTIAADARERSLKGEKITLPDSERALSDYNGTLSFSLVLYGPSGKAFSQQPKVTAYAGKRSITPYRIVWPEHNLAQVEIDGKVYVRANCYAYFSDREFRGNEMIRFIVLTGDNAEHIFNFDLAKLK